MESKQRTLHPPSKLTGLSAGPAHARDQKVQDSRQRSRARFQAKHGGRSPLGRRLSAPSTSPSAPLQRVHRGVSIVVGSRVDLVPFVRGRLSIRETLISVPIRVLRVFAVFSLVSTVSVEGKRNTDAVVANKSATSNAGQSEFRSEFAWNCTSDTVDSEAAGVKRSMQV